MSKALVIKNADFSTNKVGTITFNEDIPCTGASWDSDSVSLTSLGSVTIPYTLTPANTTDAVRITSSDPNVVSFANGLFTVEGIGSCTLTMSCNGITDTCAVTVSIEEELTYLIGFSNSRTDPDAPTVNGFVFDGSSKSRVLCGKDVADAAFTNPISYAHKAFDQDVTAIKIPNNATKIHVYSEALYNSDTAHVIYFITEDRTFINSTDTFNAYAETVNLSLKNVGGNRLVDQDVTIPSDAIGYWIVFRPNSSSDLEAITTRAAATNYAEGTMKISVDYLTE